MTESDPTQNQKKSFCPDSPKTTLLGLSTATLSNPFITLKKHHRHRHLEPKPKKMKKKTKMHHGSKGSMDLDLSLKNFYEYLYKSKN